MIIVKYDVNTAGVRVEAHHAAEYFVIVDGETSFVSEAMRIMMAAGTRGGPERNEIHIPETPEMLDLFHAVKSNTGWFGPFGMREVTQDDLDQMNSDRDDSEPEP